MAPSQKPGKPVSSMSGMGTELNSVPGCQAPGYQSLFRKRNRSRFEICLRLQISLLFLACFSVVPAGVTAADKPITVPVLVAPFSAGPLAGETILMNRMIQERQPVVLLPQETPGYIYNIRAMKNPKNWGTTLFNTEDTIIQLAFHGGSTELKEFLPEKIDIRFKLLYCEAWWGGGKVFITHDKNLTNLSQLKGKQVSIGLRSQSDWGVYPRLFLEYGYNVTYRNTDIRHLTPAALSQQLIDGVTDVAAGSFGTEPGRNNWLIQQVVRKVESAGKKMYYLGIEKDVVEKLNIKFATTWMPIELPAGTLPHQEKPIPSAINRGYKASHPDFPEDVAYHIIMGLAKLGPEMKQYHAIWNLWSPQLMLSGLTEENVHPGARRAYRELGWWDDRNREFPVTYPR